MDPVAALASTGNDPRLLEGFRWPLFVGAIALVVSTAVTPVVRKLAMRFGAVDDPKRDERRVHMAPLPRWGGLAIYLGMLASLLLTMWWAYPLEPFPMYLIGILGVGALVVVVGALDDLHQFGAKPQALFLLAAGAAITLFGSKDESRVLISGMNWPPFAEAMNSHWVAFGVWAVPITAVYVFVVSKTMDTIDGIDGLAAGIAAIAGGTITILAKYEGQPRVALIAAALTGASLGFLRLNYNPAKIIMGTGGAQFLGFVLACLSIVGTLKTAAAVAITVPMLVFGVPLYDAIQVVIRRRLSGAPITQGDKRHIHHQLLDRGLSQRQAVWVLYSIAIVLCTLLVVVVKLYG
jgi:UDP-GlcNAc:undecaprenyl-phosphate GlcNAc-1-phosphate transferase